MKSWRSFFSGRRVAQARRKAIQTFKGRLRAFILIFQHKRKQSDRRGHQHFSHTFPFSLPRTAWGGPRLRQSAFLSPRRPTIRRKALQAAFEASGGRFFEAPQNGGWRRRRRGDFAVFFGRPRFLASHPAFPFQNMNGEKQPTSTKWEPNFGVLARSCLTKPFASHMIAPSPRCGVGAAPLRGRVERTLSNYSYFGVQFECMRS